MKSESQLEIRLSDDDALILVDIQNDFLPGGAIPVPDGDAVIPIANRLHQRFAIVIATQDWHPSEHGSFAANHPGHSPGDRTQLEGLQQVLWPVHCVQNTPGAELAQGLSPRDNWHLFFKGQHANVDSYSGFFDNGNRHSTGLGDFLRERRVRRVFVMGLATDYCVKHTALDARQLGFETYVIEDGCRGVELQKGDVSKAIDEMLNAGIHVISSSNVLRRGRTRFVSAGSAGDQATRPAEIVIAETQNLRLVRRGHWDFVRRKKTKGVVAIVAITPNNELLLVEQYRPPLDNRVIEFPAGLAGDIVGAEDETLEEAARRELLEETGFQAASLRCVFTGVSSAGLTDETMTFFLASDVVEVAKGGGDETEDILVHRVPLADIDQWIDQKNADGCLIDARVPSGIYLFMRHQCKDGV